MASGAISTADAAVLRDRTTPHVITDVRLNVVTPQTVASLTVTGIPSTVPFVELTVSGSMSSVVPGQQVKVYSGSTVRTWGIVRKSPSGSTLYISPVALGEPGYSQAVEYAIQVGDSVTVYSHHPMWGLFSTIQQRTFYKQWDVPYDDQNAKPPPVANAGPWQQAKITSSSASFTLPKSGANTSFAFSPASVSSYQWSLPSGVSLASGYSLTDAVIQVSATGGQHLVSLTITDSMGKTHTAYTWLFVHDGSSYNAFGEQYRWSITSDTQTRQGREIRFKVYGADLDTDVLLPTAGVMLTWSGSPSVTDGVMVDTFIGYITKVEGSHSGEFGDVDITVQSPVLFAKNIPQPPQLLSEVTTPTNWTQCTSVLSNPRGALYYAIKWHTPCLIDMHDLDSSAPTTPRDKSFEFNTSSLYDAMKVAANAVIGNVGSASDGTTVLRQDPNMENNAFRNALDTVWTWDEADIQAPLSYATPIVLPNRETRGGGFSYDGAHIGAWMAIKRWSQGVRKTSMPNFSVTSSGGLTRVKEVVGHYHAAQNSRQSVNLKVMRNLDFTDPAYMLWHKLNIPSSYDPRGEGFVNIRVLPEKVVRVWNTDAGTKRVSVTVARETYGQPGEELVVGNALSYITNGYVYNQPVPYQPLMDSIPDLLIAGTDTGGFARTTNLTDVSPSWVAWTDYVTGTVCDMCWDYSSDYFANGYTMGDKIGAFVLSADSGTLYIYSVDDVLSDTPVFTSLGSYTMNDSGTTVTARIRSSKTTPGFVAVAWHDQTGIQVGRSTDSGATWASAVRVGSSITDTSNDDAEIGFDIDGVNQLVSGPDSSGDYALYLATTTGGTFSAVGTIPALRDMPLPTVIAPGDGDVYTVVRPITTTTTYTDVAIGTPSVDAWADSSSDSVITATPGSALHTSVGGIPATGENYVRQSRDDGDTMDYSADMRLGVRYTFKVGAPDVTDLVSWSANVSCRRASSTPPDAVTVHWTARIVTQQEVKEYTGSYDFGNGANYTSSYVNFGGGVYRWVYSWGENVFGSTVNVDEVIEYIEATIEITETRMSDSDAYYGWWLGLGNPRITATGTNVSSPGILYAVSGYASSPTWTDITPSGDYVPLYSYGLAADGADTNNLESVGNDGEHWHWHYSTDAGTAWTDNGACNYAVVRRGGDVILLGGNGVLDISWDAGSTTEDSTGDLGAVLGTMGTVRWMLAIL